MGRYELYLSTDRGSRLALLDQSGGFSYARVANGLGAFSITLPGDTDPSLLRVDRMVQIWRAPEGHRLSLEFTGFLRGWTWATDANGQTRLTIRGPDVNDLLRRRVIAYAAGTAQATMTDQADDMIKEIVDDNLESGAAAGRDMSGYGFSIAPNLAAGPWIDGAFAWKNLLDVCKDLANTAWGNGTPVYFDIVPTSATTLELQTWAAQRGRDHSMGTGTAPVIVGLDRGNLEQPSLEYDYSKEVNYVYALGDGEGSDRAVEEVTDTTRAAASVWNRCEATVAGRNEHTAAALQDAGYRRLAAGRPLIRFKGQIRETPGCLYGRDWGFGDKVTATYQGMQFDCIILAVTVSVDGSDKETIDARLEALL